MRRSCPGRRSPTRPAPPETGAGRRPGLQRAPPPRLPSPKPSVLGIRSAGSPKWSHRRPLFRRRRSGHSALSAAPHREAGHPGEPTQYPGTIRRTGGRAPGRIACDRSGIAGRAAAGLAPPASPAHSNTSSLRPPHRPARPSPGTPAPMPTIMTAAGCQRSTRRVVATAASLSPMPQQHDHDDLVALAAGGHRHMAAIIGEWIRLVLYDGVGVQSPECRLPFDDERRHNGEVNRIAHRSRPPFFDRKSVSLRGPGAAPRPIMQ